MFLAIAIDCFEQGVRGIGMLSQTFCQSEGACAERNTQEHQHAPVGAWSEAGDRLPTYMESSVGRMAVEAF